MDFHSPPGMRPSRGCSFSSFASCGQGPLLQPAAEQLRGEETLPTRNLPWRYPLAESQQIGDVSSRPPGLEGSDLDLQRTQQASEILLSEEYIPTKGSLGCKGKSTLGGLQLQNAFSLESRRDRLLGATNFFPRTSIRKLLFQIWC